MIQHIVDSVFSVPHWGPNAYDTEDVGHGGGGGKFGKNPIQKSASRGVILPDSRKSESSWTSCAGSMENDDGLVRSALHKAPSDQ